MWQSIFSIIFFGMVLSGIWLGVSWLVDNKYKLTQKEGISITEIAGTIEKEVAKVQEGVQEEIQEYKEEKEPIERASVEVLVLNGGAEAGAAGNTTQNLRDEGFTQTQASNASSYDHTGVTVYYSEKEEEAREVADVLDAFDEYDEVVTKQASTLDQQKAQVVVILGE